MKKELLAAFAAMLMTTLAFGQGANVIAPEVPTNTYSLSVRAVDQAMYRVMIEMNSMVSARVQAIAPEDKKRLDAYYAYMSNVVETTSASIDDFHWLATMPLTPIESVVLPVENQAIQNAINQLLGANVNLRISQTARLSDGMLATDKEDLLNALAKSKTYLDNFNAKDNPLDMTRVDPRVPIVEPMQLP